MSEREPIERLKDLGGEQDLPPELKAIEAELASLRPREDRLDRERLIFLAGRASASGVGAVRPAGGPHWIWPASLAGMTAVAAVLLAVVLVKPGPQVVERKIYVPVEGPADVVPASAQDETALPRVIDAPSRRPKIASDRIPEPRRRPVLRPEILDYPGRDRFRAEAPYIRMYDQLLAEGPDAWSRAGPGTGGGRARSPQPALTRQSLEELLNESA